MPSAVTAACRSPRVGTTAEPLAEASRRIRSEDPALSFDLRASLVEGAKHVDSCATSRPTGVFNQKTMASRAAFLVATIGELDLTNRQKNKAF